MKNKSISNLTFQELLDESVRIHGHLCAGQVLGVRMSMLGLDKIGIHNPKNGDRKKLIVYVEIDRCATDAVQSVTGCSPGKRSLKIVDFGKMAATFINLETEKSIRIYARDEARQKAQDYFPEIDDKYRCQTEAYKVMPDEELFSWQEVTVHIPAEDMPGRPLKRIKCAECGEYVQDKRDTTVNGRQLCKACAHGSYYELLRNPSI